MGTPVARPAGCGFEVYPAFYPNNPEDQAMPERSDSSPAGLTSHIQSKAALEEEASPDQEAEAAGSADQKDGEAPETGYLGNGRYRRKDGVVQRIDVYVPPEMAKALRVAAATREDPNGTSVSEIVCSLVKKAGYS